jgi:hypothetical protein
LRRRLFLLAVLGSLAAAQSAQAASCPAPHWVAAWYAAPSDASTGTDITDIFGPSGEVKTNVNNSSVRAILTPSVGASRVRVHLSNRFGKSSVRFASTTIAKQLQGPAVVASTIKAVTFAGGRSVTVPAGKDVISDPVDLTFNAFDNLAVSTYVSGNVGKPTEHYTARQTSYLTDSGAGDHSSDGRGDAYKNSTTTRPFVAGLDALLPGTYRAVVTFGDDRRNRRERSLAGCPWTPTSRRQDPTDCRERRHQRQPRPTRRPRQPDGAARCVRPRRSQTARCRRSRPRRRHDGHPVRRNQRPRSGSECDRG